MPFFRYGPYRPFWAVISSPDSGSVPTTRGSESSRSAVSRSIVPRSMSVKSEAVRGLAFPALPLPLPLAGASLGLRQHLGDVGPVPAGPGDDLVTGLRVASEHAAVVGRLVEQLPGHGGGQLVGGDVVGDGRPPRLGLPGRRRSASVDLPGAGSTPAGTTSSTYGP